VWPDDIPTIAERAAQIAYDRGAADGYDAGSKDTATEHQGVIDRHCSYLHDLLKDKTVYDHHCDVLNHDLPEEEKDLSIIRKRRRTIPRGTLSGQRLSWWKKSRELGAERAERLHAGNPDLTGIGDHLDDSRPSAVDQGISAEKLRDLTLMETQVCKCAATAKAMQLHRVGVIAAQLSACIYPITQRWDEAITAGVVCASVYCQKKKRRRWDHTLHIGTMIFVAILIALCLAIKVLLELAITVKKMS